MKKKGHTSRVKDVRAYEAKAYIDSHEEGTFTLLDVRQPAEYNKFHIPGARLLPLPDLPERIGELDPRRPVIAYCAIGGRSRAAAEAMEAQGFTEVYNLVGGINAWEEATAVGPVEGITPLTRGIDDPESILRLAYSMEEALEEFYSAKGGETDDLEMSSVLNRLSGMEAVHKNNIRSLLQNREVMVFNTDDGSREGSPGLMEGGFDTAEFLHKSSHALKTASDALSFAMMLEAQAMDFYAASSHNFEDQETQNLLRRLAEEEKGHMASLARMIEKQA